MWPARQPYFYRQTADGRREVSWRTWVLIWLLPVLFGLAAALLLAEAAYKRLATRPGTGEVVRVHAWEGETIFDRGRINYAPVFRYVWSDGEPTEASPGMSNPGWNFGIGARHAIRYFPGRKADVVLPGPHNWAVAGMIAAIAMLTAIPAALLSRALRRWQARGAVA